MMIKRVVITTSIFSITVATIITIDEFNLFHILMDVFLSVSVLNLLFNKNETLKSRLSMCIFILPMLTLLLFCLSSKEFRNIVYFSLIFQGPVGSTIIYFSLIGFINISDKCSSKRYCFRRNAPRAVRK